MMGLMLILLVYLCFLGLSLSFLVQVRSLLARLTCLSVLMNHPSQLSCRLMARKEDNKSKFAHSKKNNQTIFSQNVLFEKHCSQKVGSFSLTNPVPWHSFLKSGGTLELLTNYWMFSFSVSWASLWWVYFFLLKWMYRVSKWYYYNSDGYLLWRIRWRLCWYPFCFHWVI